MVRKDGALAEASWDEAFAGVVSRLGSGRRWELTSCATSNEAWPLSQGCSRESWQSRTPCYRNAPDLGFGQPGPLCDRLDAELIILRAPSRGVSAVLGYFIQRAQDRGTRLATIGGVGAGSANGPSGGFDYQNAQQAVDLATSAAKEPFVVYSVG